MPLWLDDAVFYEIYPQSFYDANGDGTGDFEGIIQKLDYVQSLGCNAIWLNPCFDSPFRDAGYDVRDYKKTAARYGTNEDLRRLFSEAHKRGIRVVLDLVAGHTSEEHDWFVKSARLEPSGYSGRYIWTSHCFESAPGFNFIGGESPRNATYLLNFFKCQPALNYGFFRPERPWQLPPDHPDCAATLEALKDIMRFWLSAGCDGFRVDMAPSLVKNDDEKKTGNTALWKNVRAMLDREFPEAALIAEWSDPPRALKAGFHADFLLNITPRGYRSLMRAYDDSPGFAARPDKTGAEDRSFFKKEGKGDITLFLDDYLSAYEQTKNDGFISLLTGNHDTIRARFSLSPEELAIAYAMIFTFPGVPFLYYGDEIGLRYLDVPTKEGGYFRTGSRTPMQWNRGKNLGFSGAGEDRLYLPVDKAPDAPTVEDAEKDPSSLLNRVRGIIAFRRAHEELRSLPNLEIVYAEKGKFPFVYRRGPFVIAVNPAERKASVPATSSGRVEYAIGSGSLQDGVCAVDGRSFVLFNTAG
jgi:maltose alpha-D-glucosyltransferase/alpha-amylase